MTIEFKELTEHSQIIFAPHFDDELIGCYSLLKNKCISHVIFFHNVFNEYDPNRLAEAQKCADTFGFHMVSMLTFRLPKIPEGALLYVPHIADGHPEHKQVNSLAYTLPNKKYFYSVDMNVTKNVLSPDTSRDKKQQLDNIYPSQKKLWKKNAKYYLFETCLSEDSSVWRIHKWKLPDGNKIKISCTSPYLDFADIILFIDKIKSSNLKKIYNCLVANFPTLSFKLRINNESIKRIY